MYKNKLSKILHTNKIKDSNINYYYTKYPEWYKEYNILPMFDDIEAFNYHKPLQKLRYNSDIINIAEEYSNKTILNNTDDTDQIILEYVKCRPLSQIITIWEKYTDNKLFEYLNKNGNVYYIKHINLSFKGACSLIYQLFADTPLYKDLNSIQELLINTYNFDKNSGGDITVILFDNINNILYKNFKMNIYTILKKNNFTISNKFYKTIEQSQIYFCENSLIFLEKQLLERHININMRKSRTLLATFKNWYTQNINLLNMRGFLIFSSSILYVYGIRGINDIDIYADYQSYGQTVDKYLLNEDSKFYFIDFTMPNTSSWKQYWEQWSKKWAQLIGTNSFNEIIYNPKYHFYYMGMKFMTIDGDIQRRIIRQRPRSMVDLIKIKQLLNYKIKLPNIPLTEKKYIQLDDDENIDDIQMENNQTYDEKTREIVCILDIDKQKFLNTMQWYLKYMYHEEYEILDIERLLGIKKIRIKKNKN